MNNLEPVTIFCPSCGERIEILVDCSVERQSYIEDCQVCCRPITIRAVLDEAGLPLVEAGGEED